MHGETGEDWRHLQVMCVCETDLGTGPDSMGVFGGVLEPMKNSLAKRSFLHEALAFRAHYARRIAGLGEVKSPVGDDWERVS
jgi:hypothetical protein